MVLAAVLAAPAWFAAQQRDVWGLWDYGTLVAPFIVWLGLSLSRSGYRGLVNRLEPIALAILIPTALSIRILLLDQWLGGALAMSIAIFAICTLSAVVLWWAIQPRE